MGGGAGWAKTGVARMLAAKVLTASAQFKNRFMIFPLDVIARR